MLRNVVPGHHRRQSLSGTAETATFTNSDQSQPSMPSAPMEINDTVADTISNNNVNVSNKPTEVGGARKSFTSKMFPIFVSMTNASKGATALAKGDEAAPPVPKKLRITEEDEGDEEEEMLDASHLNGSALAVNDQTKPPRQPNQQQQRFVRQASSNGSQSTDNSAGAAGPRSSFLSNRLAKNNIQIVEARNKLNEKEAHLAVANKRIEELEKENERLIKENRELRKRLEQQNPNGSNRGRNAGKLLQGQDSSESNNSNSDEDMYTIRVENLDKQVTSKSLMQTIETNGVEVLTVRVCRNSATGALSGYCSFASLGDATKAIEALKKLGLAAGMHQTAEERKASSNVSASAAAPAGTAPLKRLWKS